MHQLASAEQRASGRPQLGNATKPLPLGTAPAPVAPLIAAEVGSLVRSDGAIAATMTQEGLITDR